MVELAKETLIAVSEGPEYIPRRSNYRPSMSVGTADTGRLRRQEAVRTEEFEWMMKPELVPPLLKELSETWGLSAKEMVVQQALASTLLWDTYYFHAKGKDAGTDLVAAYVLERVIPDLKVILNSFYPEMSSKLHSVAISLEKARYFIESAHLAGRFVPNTTIFMEGSPFVALYRGNAPIINLYETVILTPDRTAQVKNTYFSHMDRSFSGWVVGELKNYYSSRVRISRASSSLANSE